MTTQVEPRWLSAEQQRIWRSFLNGVARINDRLDAELRPFGLDLGEYEILVHLSECERHMLRMSDPRRTGTAVPVPAHPHDLADGVEGPGAAGPRARPTGAAVNAIMTPAGYRLLVDAAPSHVESVRPRAGGPGRPPTTSKRWAGPWRAVARVTD